MKFFPLWRQCGWRALMSVSSGDPYLRRLSGPPQGTKPRVPGGPSHTRLAPSLEDPLRALQISLCDKPLQY